MSFFVQHFKNGVLIFDQVNECNTETRNTIELLLSCSNSNVILCASDDNRFISNFSTTRSPFIQTGWAGGFDENELDSWVGIQKKRGVFPSTFTFNITNDESLKARADLILERSGRLPILLSVFNHVVENLSSEQVFETIEQELSVLSTQMFVELRQFYFKIWKKFPHQHDNIRLIAISALLNLPGNQLAKFPNGLYDARYIPILLI